MTARALRYLLAVSFLTRSPWPLTPQLTRLERTAASEDPRKAENLSKTHDLLQRLPFVTGNNDLITGNEIGVIGRLAFVDFRDVYWDLREHAVILQSQNNNSAPVASGQHAARLGQCFGNGHAMAH